MNLNDLAPISTDLASTDLEQVLKARRSAGRKLLIPYIPAGLSDDWLDVVVAIASAGADAIEIGVPFSDPIMDGPIIQRASLQSLNRGTTPMSVFSELSRLEVGVPLIAMTYCNLLFHAGYERFLGWLLDARVEGTIFPDLPMEEAGGWSSFAKARGVANILLVSPTTPKDRISQLCEKSDGFVYGVGVMGVTGLRDSLSSGASEIARSIKDVSDRIAMVGVGISTPEQAKEVVLDADGVIVGSALVKILLDGGGPTGAYDFVSSLRLAIDG